MRFCLDSVPIASLTERHRRLTMTAGFERTIGFEAMNGFQGAECGSSLSGRGWKVSNSPESIIRAFLASWVKSDVDEVASFFDTNAVWVDGQRGVHHGVDDIKAAFGADVELVPSTTSDIKAIVANGRTVIVERVDNFQMGGIALRLEAVGVFELDGDGRIERWRDYYDPKSIIEQIEAAGITVPE